LPPGSAPRRSAPTRPALEDHHRRDRQSQGVDAVEASHQWIAWIRHYADRVDPIRQLPGLPDETAIGHDELRPYLDGFSPDGLAD
jgi:hypothetical protein